MEPPDPDAKIGRMNNQKITFDRMVREKWIEICESYEYHIEREPLPDQEHLPKAQLIALRKRERKLDERDRRQDARETALDRRAAELKELDDAMARKVAEANAGLDRMNEAIDAANEYVKAMMEAEAENLRESEWLLGKCQSLTTEAEKNAVRQLRARIQLQAEDLTSAMAVPDGGDRDVTD